MSDGRRVYVYKVVPTDEHGQGSTLAVHVVSETHDLTDLTRIMRVHLGETQNFDTSKYTGIKSAELVTTAVLDPRIAV